MSLQTYQQKRNFERTVEPRGRQSRRKGHAFVIQKHDARNLHYDFRLELGGVLLSWAVPKGPSLDPGVKRLAMQTEDHPIEYGDFEGVIPEGEYGGGAVLVWDRGTWEPEGDAEDMYRRGRLSFALHGEKLHGGFHLVRTKPAGKAGKPSWLLFKSKDEAAEPGSDDRILVDRPESVQTGRDIATVARDPDHVWTSKAAKKTTASTKKRAAGAAANASRAVRAANGAGALAALARHPGARRAALPEFVEPELATLVAEPPEGDDWLHEIKLDGYRILARIERGRARLLSRRGHDWTARLPSIASAFASLPIESALLDGEVVVLRDDGVSDFQRLQNSMEAGRDVACVYFVFDALFCNGFDLRGLPLGERKALLRELLAPLDNPRVRFGDHVQGEGAAFFAQACQHGLEGIVCKRADSRYSSGRSRAWLKVKCLMRQEFVVGGYTEPSGSRRHLGALLVGVREKDGALTYAGKVGTGFTQASLAQLVERLAPLEQKKPPFTNPPTGSRGVHWVKPALVAEIAFMERTQDGLIRHASFQGLREDKAAADVRLETPESQHEESAPRPRAARAKRAAAAKKTEIGTKPAAAKKKTSRAPRAGKPASALDIDPSQLEITHPDRVLYPDQGITKRELMLHYARVARWMLPQIAERPLMLVRCPEGTGQQCFHQKHPSRGMPKAVLEVKVREKKGPEAHLMIRSVEGLLGLVQMGALEIHAWGCRASHLDCPDQLVFDLDPGEGVPWQRVLEGATTLRARLEELGLCGFLRATGGKGLHVVVPVTATTPWEAAKAFSKRLAQAMVRDEPDRYLATMAKRERKGKIFIDYLRNAAGATAIASYSTRARAGAPIATPLAWDELTDALRPDRFNLKSFEQRLADYDDPWASFDEARAPIPT